MSSRRRIRCSTGWKPDWPPDQVFALADFLREKGAQAISVSGIDYVFTQDNPLFEKLKAGL